jgi:hypothetical protein
MDLYNLRDLRDASSSLANCPAEPAISNPAQNARPTPDNTMTLTSESCSANSNIAPYWVYDLVSWIHVLNSHVSMNLLLIYSIEFMRLIELYM